MLKHLCYIITCANSLTLILMNKESRSQLLAHIGNLLVQNFETDLKLVPEVVIEVPIVLVKAPS
jgi:hypothetical protein